MTKKTALPIANAPHHTPEPTHPWLLFVSQNGRTIITGMVAAVILLVISLQITSSTQGKKELDFTKATLLASQLQNNHGTVEELTKIIKRHPELRPKYQGLLAHTELKLGIKENTLLTAQTLISANTLYQEQPDLLPLKEYSEVSLVVTAGDLDTALERSLRLQRKLEEEDRFNNLLVLNTLRITSLYYQLENREEEAAWLTQLEQKLGHISQPLEKHLTSGAVTFRNYIDQRKAILDQIL